MRTHSTHFFAFLKKSKKILKKKNYNYLELFFKFKWTFRDTAIGGGNIHFLSILQNDSFFNFTTESSGRFPQNSKTNYYFF